MTYLSNVQKNNLSITLEDGQGVFTALKQWVKENNSIFNSSNNKIDDNEWKNTLNLLDSMGKLKNKMNSGDKLTFSKNEQIQLMEAMGLSFKIKEAKNLKPIDVMSKKEIQNEINKFKQSNPITFNKIYNNYKEYYDNVSSSLLFDIRQYMIENDENSNIIDGHIGTFSQNHLGSCWYLAGVNSFSDKKVNSLVTTYKDNKGDVTGYLVKFPNSKESVMIEGKDLAMLNSKAPYVIIDGQKKYLTKGDKDVQLFELAGFKLLGDNINGGREGEVSNLFRTDNGKATGKLFNITNDDLKSINKNRQNALFTCSLNMNAIDKINEQQKENQNKLKNISFINFSQNTKEPNSLGSKRLKIDGVFIEINHAFSIQEYDEKNGIIKIVNPKRNNETIEISEENFIKYFSMSIDMSPKEIKSNSIFNS